jgi:CHAT domain-containing protein/tetratricopeptide (TPR) repeat protein
MCNHVAAWLATFLSAALVWTFLSFGALAQGKLELEALERQVVELVKAEKHAEALPLAAKALVLAEHEYGVEAAEVAVALLRLGEVLSGLNRYADAEPHERRSVAIREKALGPDHPLTAEAMIAAAGSLQELQRPDDAAVLYRRALAALEASLGADHIKVADAVEPLAQIAKSQGRIEEAEAFYVRALTLREKALDPEHEDLLSPILALADIAIRSKELAKAEGFVARAVAIREKMRGPDDEVTISLLAALGTLYRSLDRFTEAEPLARRVLASRERALGPEHIFVASSLVDLADVHRGLKRYGDAEPLYGRALAIGEKVLGPDHLDVASTLKKLAQLYSDEGRFDLVEAPYLRILSIREKALAPGHPDVLGALDDLASLYHIQSRYLDSGPLYQRVLAITEKVRGKDHPDVAEIVAKLASQLVALGRFAEAEPLMKRNLAIQESNFGPTHSAVAGALIFQSYLYQSWNRPQDAEPLLKRALSIREQLDGRDSFSVALILNNLTVLYSDEDRNQEAEPLARRALAIMENERGADHPVTGLAVSNLATVLSSLNRNDETELLYRRSIGILEKTMGGEHPLLAKSLHNLGHLYRIQKRFAEAEPLIKRAVAISEKVLGPAHPDFANALRGLAWLYADQGRPADAIPLHRRSIDILTAAIGPDDTGVSNSLDSLAELAFAGGDWAGAADSWRHSTGIIVRRARRGIGSASASLERRSIETARWNSQFQGLVKAGYRLATQSRRTSGNLDREMLEIAQWGLYSEAAASLTQMAARGAKGDGELAGLARERQDLVADWRRRDAQHLEAVVAPKDKRDTRAEAANVARLAEIDKRIAEIDARLATDFPDFAALSRPEPLTVPEIQNSLGPDEALVALLDTGELKGAPEETFVWIVTKTGMRWLRSNLGTAALASEVAALRCGLDAAAWEAPADRPGDSAAQLAEKKAKRDRANACLSALGSRPIGSLPFDHARAHRLYKSLLGEARDMIKGKHLLIVPAGPLTQLPFQVLVTRPPPTSGDHKKVAWLARDHAITVLPSVSSLKALRRIARPSTASRPMIGFGNPLLDGDPSQRQLAALARDYQHCRPPSRDRVAAIRGERSGLKPVAIRSGLADLAHLKAQTPLPETADELCAVARDLKADPEDVHLGARATETEFKALSASGRLAQYRIVHFATHGALAGEISGAREPGLILTPPDVPTDTDDGYLSGSEIAALRLDADWVILSACNTAGPAGSGQGAGPDRSGEALSGLARVFFYAGARALLVSHWAVDSAAAVKLITHAAGSVARDPTIGRGEALRQSMLAMIDRGRPHEAHPAAWAPFIAVGEGSTRR